MSSRWFAPSSPVLASGENQSYISLNVYDDVLQEKLRNLTILNHLPILTWVEKALLIIDFFQLFALQWVMAQPWPWPYLWSYYTRPLVYFNLDHFSMTQDGALAGRTGSLISQWGEMDNYGIYAFGFALPQFLVFAAVIFFRMRLDLYGQATTKPVYSLVGIALLISYIFYLPACLAVSRLFYCEDGESGKEDYLSADPSADCWGTEHLTFFVVCTSLSLPVFLGLPIVMYRYIKHSMIYHFKIDHEKRIQVWEILQMLELDNYWIKEQLWLTSSFTKYGAFYRLHITLLKAWLLVIFIVFRFDLKLQSALNCVSITVFCLYYTFGFHVLPYRTHSSNALLLPSFALMLAYSWYGLANAFDVENAMTIGSTQSYFLGLLSVTCWILMAVILCHTIVQASYAILDWPSYRTLSRLWHNKEMLPKVAKWVETIREALIIKADFLLTPVEVADINNLEEAIRRLRSCWLAARGCGSLFEMPISEQLEELLYIHSRNLPNALRKFDFWDEQCRDEEVLEELHDRHYRLSMMAPRKRRILLKLLAIRFIKGDRGKFSMDIALDHMRLQQLEKDRKEAELALMEALADEMGGTRFGFRAFSKAARSILYTGSTKDLMVANAATVSAKQQMLQDIVQEQNKLSMSLSAEQYGDGADGGYLVPEDRGMDADAPMQFSDTEKDEATKMIIRLRERTELALNKHHHAKQAMLQQLSQSVRDAVELNSSNYSLTAATHDPTGLRQVSTMELIKETVDPDEQKDLEELYFLWDEAIQLYEVEEFPGDYELLNKDAENWYTYRGLVAQRLEVVARTLAEQDYEMEIDGSLIIEEGDESDSERGDRAAINALNGDIEQGGGGGGGGSDAGSYGFENDNTNNNMDNTAAGGGDNNQLNATTGTPTSGVLSPQRSLLSERGKRNLSVRTDL